MKLLVCFSALLLGTLQAANLLIDPATGVVRSTRVPANAVVEQQGDKVDFVLTGSCGNFSYSLPLSPESRYLVLRMKMRSTDLVPGKAKWQAGSMAMRFHDKDGKAVGPWPKVFVVSGTTGLQTCERVYPIPENAVTLRLKPANFGQSGKVEFKEVQIEELKQLDQYKRSTAPAVTPAAPEAAVPQAQLTPEQNLLIAPAPGGVPQQGLSGRNCTLQMKSGRLNATIEGNGKARLKIPVSPDWKAVTLSMRWKLTGVQPGKQKWHNARIAMRFYKGNDGIGPWPNVPQGDGTTPWQEFSRRYEIPAGATCLILEPANLGTAGNVEIEDLSLRFDRNL